MKIQQNVPLAPLTTFKVGGDARLFVRASTENEVIEASCFARDSSIPMFVLGGGSNILVSDRGFDGLVVQIGIKGVRDVTRGDHRVNDETGDFTFVEAGAGEDWDLFVDNVLERGLAGVECLSGIPGLVGGTPVQNVGAYGQDVSETIVSVRCFDRRTGSVIEISNADCRFEYRKSIFNSNMRDRFIVLNVLFRLRRGGAPNVSYRDLAGSFGTRIPTLKEVRDAVLQVRRSKSMVIDETDQNSRSAGSFFKNPVVSIAVFERIKSDHANVPGFEAGDGVKIPAAWLIEKAGFNKGFTAGEAGISANHTLAIINRGHARADEIVVLMRRIQEAVADKFGIDLLPEPVFVGF